MRCARCDRPAIPQATGFSSQGRIVFGWCLNCLEETGCGEITVNSREVRCSSTRLDYTEPRKPRRSVSTRAERQVDSIENRFRLLSTVARVLTLWGLVIVLVGVSFLFRKPLLPPQSPSVLGNGTPALLIGGGGSTTLLGLSLWAWTTAQKTTTSVTRERFPQRIL